MTIMVYVKGLNMNQFENHALVGSIIKNPWSVCVGYMKHELPDVEELLNSGLFDIEEVSGKYYFIHASIQFKKSVPLTL